MHTVHEQYGVRPKKNADERNVFMCMSARSRRGFRHRENSRMSLYNPISFFQKNLNTLKKS